MNDLYNKLERVKELFDPEVTDTRVEGLLYAQEGCCVFPYNYPCLSYYITLDKKGDKYEVFACIRSIDDSGCSIFSVPDDTLEKARKRFEGLIDIFKGFNYACPTDKVLKDKCMKIGMSPDFW